MKVGIETTGAIIWFVMAGFLTSDLGAESPVTHEVSAKLLFHGGFEDGRLDRYGDADPERNANKVNIVSSVSRRGRASLQITLDRQSDQEVLDHRTDFWIKGMSGRALQAEDYWFAFSTRLPDDWQADTQAELFAQWIGKGTPSPPLAIYTAVPGEFTEAGFSRVFETLIC